jgi:hypothetical protein
MKKVVIAGSASLQEEIQKQVKTTSYPLCEFLDIENLSNYIYWALQQ